MGKDGGEERMGAGGHLSRRLFSDQAFTSYSLFVSGLHMGNETKEQKEMSPRTHVRFFLKKILLKYNRHIINFRCTC